MKILNLYAGIGGNRKMWGAEHDITSVELIPHIAEAYQKMYPNDRIVIADAHQFLLEHFKEYDFIWSSPPCPTHSRLVTAKQGWGIFEYPDMSLYQEIIFLRHFFKGNWVVENVIPYYKPLIEPEAVVDRHLVWSNFPIASKSFDRKFNVARHKKELLADYHGITLPEGTKDQRKLLRNAVHPEMGDYIITELSKVGI